MIRVTIDVKNPRPDSIYAALARKLGRNPTNEECRIECLRILDQAAVDRQSRQ